MVGFSTESPLLSKSLPLSDSELMLGIRQGDRQAMEYLYQKYWPMIAHFVWLNKGLQHEAEDLFQDGIIILYEKIIDKDFCLQYSLKTYLYAICRNQWLKRLRKKRSFMIVDSECQLENIPELEAEEESLPDEQEVCQTIQQLKDPCYTLLIGYYYKKMSLEQLAKVLHYATPNVAKQRKFRCLERLKKCFQERTYVIDSNLTMLHCNTKGPNDL
jgi:RNA polymerase sigma factor (sigma-70 family)